MVGSRERELLGQNREPIVLTPDNHDLAANFQKMGLEVRCRDFSLRERIVRLLQHPKQEIVVIYHNLKPVRLPELLRHPGTH